MKIISYSDVHLEFGSDWSPAENVEGDLMILAGDIINLKNYKPINSFLKNWSKPVLYVMGNHEYYTQKPMGYEEEAFKAWFTDTHPNVTLLLDNAVTIDGVNFFGGTMWTDFNNSDPLAQITARQQMNDFRLIKNLDGTLLQPLDTVRLHENFVAGLLYWLDQDLIGPRVVISHHAPVINPNTQYKNSPLMPAFNSLDMLEIIKQYQPALWVYGHTHECDYQMIDKTKIISNQLGYPTRFGYECPGFDKAGMQTTL